MMRIRLPGAVAALRRTSGVLPYPVVRAGGRWCSTAAARPDAPKPSRADTVISFIDNNGGKLVMLAVAVVGGLIYRYYEGIQDRNRVERLVEGEAKIEPYEIQMLRTANGYDLETYKEAIQSLRRESLSWSSVLPYAALVDIISSSLKQQQKPLKLGYLLDRLVLGQVLRAAGSSAGSFSEHPLPLPFLVCLLSLPMESDVHSRLEGLYHAVTVLNEEAEEVRREQLVELVQALVDSDQVPSEKQIEESGVKYPIHLYRRRSADGMVAAYEEKSLKLPKDDKKERWSEDEFTAFMTSRYLCAWGSCYRGQE